MFFSNVSNHASVRNNFWRERLPFRDIREAYSHFSIVTISPCPKKHVAGRRLRAVANCLTNVQHMPTLQKHLLALNSEGAHHENAALVTLSFAFRLTWNEHVEFGNTSPHLVIPTNHVFVNILIILSCFWLTALLRKQKRKHQTGENKCGLMTPVI